MFNIIIGFFIYNLFENLIHKFTHCRYNSYLKYYHSKHHKISYPLNKLLDYSPYKYESYAFLIFGPYMVSYAGILYYIFDWDSYIIIITENVILLFISDHLHSNYHIKDSYLEKYNWFLKRRELHLNHHKNINTNYSLGGLTYIFDKYFKTYNNINTNYRF